MSHYGSSTPPYDTWKKAAWFIVMAAEEAGPNDTVRVAPGLYLEPDIILKGGISLIGAGIDSCSVELGMSNETSILCDSGRISVSDLSFRLTFNKPCEAVTYYGSGMVLEDTLIIERCRFENFEIAVECFAHFARLADCLFVNCGGQNGPVYHFDWSSGNAVFERDTFVKTHEDINFPVYIGLDLPWESDSIAIRNCVFPG